MADGLERLSLSDVQSLVYDVMSRIGASPEAADGIAQIVRLAESSGLPELGLERVPHLIELVRTGLADPTAIADAEATAPALFRIDARRGFADAAITAWLPAFETSVRAHGIATVAVHNCADIPSPVLHATAIALRGLAALALPDQTGAGRAALILPAVSETRPFLRCDLEGSDTAPWGAALTALVADALPIKSVGEHPSGAARSISLIGILPGPGANSITRALTQRHSYSAVSLDLDDTIIQATLLERIINA